ncbi:MAG TPA: hypothetical protein PK167_04190 [Prolixibacteraceae bacterium]|nr:hypothetical protein [Prolixibacteraceae bacterium]
MKRILFAIPVVGVLLASCSSYRYIHDASSLKRQHELQSERSGRVASDILLTLGSMVVSAAAEVDVGYFPAGQVFKRLRLVSVASDTLFVNMFTDATWDNENYCDFTDIRIPPGKTCRLLVPIGVTYNLYFGSSASPDEDELLQIHTAGKRRIRLSPGMTVPPRDVKLDEIQPSDL